MSDALHFGNQLSNGCCNPRSHKLDAGTMFSGGHPAAYCTRYVMHVDVVSECSQRNEYREGFTGQCRANRVMDETLRLRTILSRPIKIGDAKTDDRRPKISTQERRLFHGQLECPIRCFGYWHCCGADREVR